MADKKRPSSQEKLSRPSTKGSKKSIKDEVSKLTIRALKEFKLDDEENIGTTPEGQRPWRQSEPTEQAASLQPTYEPHGEFNEFKSLPDTQEVDDETGIPQDYQEEIPDSGMDAGIESGSDDEIDDDMIVLDPEHPLMKRFQAAYKGHLLKQLQKVSLEVRELEEENNYKKKDREELGVELYAVQQELARQQMVLEKEHDSLNETEQLRKKAEVMRSEIRSLHNQVQGDFKQQHKTTSELQLEVENLAAKLRYMEDAKKDMRSDIAIMKRATDKTGVEVTKAEEEKRKQDLLVNMLIQAVDHLREDIQLYESQLAAQKEETKSALQTLTEATTELEAIQLEKKQLLQQWNSSLIGIRRRDEANTAMQEAVSLQNQRIMSIETELDGYKRQIKKSQEQNEQLTYMQNRIETDIALLRKQIGICQNKHEALKIQYSSYSRALYETEQQLNRATTEATLKENEANVLRKQIEREFLEKVKLEDMVMEKMREQLTADKASQYTKKVTDKVRRRATELERGMADVENEISKDVLEISNATSRVRRLQDTLASINNDIHQKNETISRIENEMVKRNAVVEKKQGTIDQYNKKIDQILSKEGDEEYTGPLEFQIKTLQKQIDAKVTECLSLQQYWLRQQNELVKMIKDVNNESNEVESLKKQSTILLQKKLRIEGEIGSQQSSMNDIERSIRAMQNDMTKLNILIHSNKGKQDSLQQDNVLKESEFMDNLREAELGSVRMQNDIDGLKEEKKRLLNALVEAERQIMLWEKKTQLAKEARNAVDSETGQGEIHAMRAEIHRMEVRLAQLMRQQEKMIQDMEKSVFRRECIIVKGDAQAKTGKAKDTKGTFQKKLLELKKKIKQTAQDASSCDDDIRQLREQQQMLSQSLEEKQVTERNLTTAIDDQEFEVEQATETKHKNLADIVAKQQRVKYYNTLKDKKYSSLCKTPEKLDSEIQKQRDRFQSLLTIVDRLNVEYPSAQTALRRITLSLGYRGIPVE
eukprot:gene8980-9938_t